MILPPYVIRKSTWMSLFFNRHVANTIFGYILLPSPVYDNLKSDSPKLVFQALLIHEEVHRVHQINEIFFSIKYISSKKFKHLEEESAVKEAIKFLKQKRYTVPADRIMDILNDDVLFLYPVSTWLSQSELRTLISNA